MPETSSHRRVNKEDTLGVMAGGRPGLIGRHLPAGAKGAGNHRIRCPNHFHLPPEFPKGFNRKT